MHEPLQRYAWLSIWAALATIALKAVAWRLTGSVGLLADALESSVNLVGALMALAMLSLAATPPDARHPHGHGKAEYFSSGFEGALIVLAALGIGYAAVGRLLAPQPLQSVGIGLVLSLAASLVNLGTGWTLLRVGRRRRSITLEANAHHLLTDVWTSAGVILGVALVWMTGRWWLDPAIALLLAANIVWTGWQLLRRSAAGLMDASIPEPEVAAIAEALASYRRKELRLGVLRTRQAGSRSFITIDLGVPGDWSIREAHALSGGVVAEICRVLPGAEVAIQLAPSVEPAGGARTGDADEGACRLNAG